MACIESGVNMTTVDFGADINNKLSDRKQDISVRNPDSQSPYGYFIRVANPLDCQP